MILITVSVIVNSVNIIHMLICDILYVFSGIDHIMIAMVIITQAMSCMMYIGFISYCYMCMIGTKKSTLLLLFDDYVIFDCFYVGLLFIWACF